MIWHLIAAVFAGLGAAGVGLLLRLVSGKRLPRWIVPVFAGLGMLGYQIHSEYTWFQHRQAQLPESARVVSVDRSPMPWRPWTYLFPMASGFDVVDEQSLARARQDGQRLVEFLLYRFDNRLRERLTPQAYLLNCTTRELVPLVGETRTPQVAEMRRLEAGAPLHQTLCRES